ILTVLGGQAAMVFGSGDGYMWAMQPRTGAPIWKYQLSRHGINVTPLVVGDRVYIAHSEENREDNTMGAVAAVNGIAKGLQGDITEKGELWRDKEVMVGRSSMVLVDGRIYSADDSGTVFVHDAETGK